MTASPASPLPLPPPPSANLTRLRIFSAVLLTFLVYLSIGLPMAVLPGYIHQDLGYSSFIAGLGISMQYIATLISRPYAGRSADTLGPKRTVQTGMLLSLASGLFLVLTVLCGASAALSLLALIVSRLLLGVAESLVGTGSISWGISQNGPAFTAKVISWNGIASYAALAIGAPLGVAMQQGWGFMSVAAVTAGLPLLGYAIARIKAATAVLAHGETVAFKVVLRRVLACGLALGLGSIGFGTIATFITLYFASVGWADAAWCLSAFGIAFSAARITLGGTIRRFGGYRVAIVTLPLEFAGLVLLWLAPEPGWAILGAALTGFGFSLVFPALAVEAVALVPLRNRGAAIGAYTLFLDVSLGITGPLAGLIIGQYGYPSVYLFAAAGTLAALAIVIRSLGRSKRLEVLA